jgi:ABC-type transporter Mla MlaB component
MLRITINNAAQAPSLVLEGKLVEPWVKEIEKIWENALATEPSGAMVVDLTAVTLVDAEGRELLTRMRRQGAMLVSAGALMNVIVEEIEAEVKKEVRSGVQRPWRPPTTY